MPEAILDLNIEASRVENAVNQVLKTGAVDVVTIISTSTSRKVGSSFALTRRDFIHLVTGDAKLVQNVAAGCDDRITSRGQFGHSAKLRALAKIL
jgi:hypothetical protein